MGVGDPILVGNSNVGDVGFGDATIISADPRSASTACSTSSR